jgi:phospholipid/cholesterol/gamma-HCH transport system permease protein
MMQVGGQLEGLRGVGLDPYAVLVAPRVVAMALSVVGLAGVTFLSGVLFEAVAARWVLGLPAGVFFDSFAHMLRPGDLVGGVVKSSAFGLALALVSTAVGLRAQGGARAVGQAAASAVVLGSASIFLLDFLLTSALARVLA